MAKSKAAAKPARGQQPPDMAPAVNDAYTGMLTISLLALIGGAVLLYLDFSQYPDAKPPTMQRRPVDAPPPADPKGAPPPVDPKGKGPPPAFP